MSMFGQPCDRLRDRLAPLFHTRAVTLLFALCVAGVPQTWAQEAGAGKEAATGFDINAFQVKGNKWLPAGEVEDAVYEYTGPNRTPGDVEAARAALQAVYEKRGYSTVVVVIPEQSVDGGVIRLEIESQTVGKLVVRGAHDPDAIRLHAPSLAAGQVPNLHDVQRDIVALNQLPHRRVTPEFLAGEGPGTLDVELRVEEKSPLHATLELNNYTSPSTTDLRASASIRLDDLWGRGDSFSVSVQSAPERMDDGTVYSTNYLARLSPSLQVLVYGIRSDSDISVVGDVNVVGAGNMGGLRLMVSLPPAGNVYHSVTAGIDYKSFNEDVTLGADSAAAPIKYWPVSATWRTDWIGEEVSADLSLGATLGLRGIGDDAEVFDYKRYQARPNFFIVRPEASRTITWPGDVQWMIRLTGQWSGEPLISNEQFSLGGTYTVRGYFESEVLADYGAALQTELRSASFAQRLGGWADELRLLAFLDGGAAALRDALPGQEDDWHLASAGLGLRFRVLNYLNGSMDLAVPLYDGPSEEHGTVTTRFRIWGEF